MTYIKGQAVGGSVSRPDKQGGRRKGKSVTPVWLCFYCHGELDVATSRTFKDARGKQWTVRAKHSVQPGEVEEVK